MAQQVQELIDKIKSEGVQAAEQKAKEIESQAQQQAQKIVADAQREAKRLLEEATQEIQKKQESSQVALKHAARDTLLSLRKEIGNTLTKIITLKVSETLSADELGKVIVSIAQKAVEGGLADSGIEISLNDRDLKKLKEGFLVQLKKEVKKPIQLKAAEEIGRGFTISFDEGKSCFDFTDASLAEYLGAYLNEQVASLFNGSVKKN